MRIAIVGTGVIGGSVGLAARQRLGATVRGIGPEAPRALERGALDLACASLEEALDDAEIAFVATPLGVLEETVDAVLTTAPAGCVVTDVGSTKTAVVVGRDDERFVGGHPLAGSEASGIEHAREDLFADAVWYLTPTASTSGVLYERLHRALAGIGARPAAIDPDVHDRLMAAVSHLPHVLANVLVAQAIRAVDDGETIPATGPSFRDATRVAGANPALWPDILLGNRDALLTQLDEAIARLTDVRAALEASDRAAVAAFQEQAHAERRALLETHLGAGPTRELRVAVPNRPGVIADLALHLGRAGINITDLSLTATPDNSQGEVGIFVATADADRACGIIQGMGLHVT